MKSPRSSSPFVPLAEAAEAGFEDGCAVAVVAACAAVDGDAEDVFVATAFVAGAAIVVGEDVVGCGGVAEIAALAIASDETAAAALALGMLAVDAGGVSGALVAAAVGESAASAVPRCTRYTHAPAKTIAHVTATTAR